MDKVICPECGHEDITDDIAAFSMLNDGDTILVCMDCYFHLGGEPDNNRPPHTDCMDTWNYTTKEHNVVVRREATY